MCQVLNSVLNEVFKMVNYVKIKPLISQLFPKLCTEMSSQRMNLIDWLIDFYGVRLRLWTAATTGHIAHPPDDIWIRERRWNDIDRGKPRKWGKSLSQCHFVHHISHMDPSLETGSPATNRLSHVTAMWILCSMLKYRGFPKAAFWLVFTN
jgi:hypothetical protein